MSAGLKNGNAPLIVSSKRERVETKTSSPAVVPRPLFTAVIHAVERAMCERSWL
jgi:hypothetical protein